MGRKVIIIGQHPITDDLIRQYEGQGCSVKLSPMLSAAGVSMNDFDEACVLTASAGEKSVETPGGKMEADNHALAVLSELAKGYVVSEHNGKRLLCHLLLQSQTTLWLLQAMDLYEDINATVELCPFTMADQWAKNVFCNLPGNVQKYPSLDWQQISAASNKKVHLVIVGFSEMSESLAMHAALIAHFPNYVRDHSLRSRITIIDPNISRRRNAFIQRYHNLFDNSYYRYIELGSKKQTFFHKPMYNESREDFVDVEWEFVQGDIHDTLIQEKLRLWTDDAEQLLTIALCTDDCDRNQDEAFVLPAAVYRKQIPILVFVHQEGLLAQVIKKDGYRNIYPFGMENCGYDIDIPLWQMAKRLHYFYLCSYGQQGVPTNLPQDEMEVAWSQVSAFSMRYSNINSVMTIATKMRSLGHDSSDWEKFYALTQEEVEQLSAVEHNRWSVERLVMGFRPPRDDERQQIRDNIGEFLAAKRDGGEMPKEYLKDVFKRKKIHYDLCAYRELSEDKTGQNVKVYDYDLTASIPLIANSFKEQES